MIGNMSARQQSSFLIEETAIVRLSRSPDGTDIAGRAVVVVQSPVGLRPPYTNTTTTAFFHLDCRCILILFVAGHTRHRKHMKWTPGRLKNWARDIGPEVLRWVSRQLDIKDHPEQAYRVCLGLLNLSREYPAQRLDSACRITNQEGLLRLKQIQSILRSNRDRLTESPGTATELPQDHENIRGPQTYH